MFKRVRYYIFLKDVFLLAIAAFGGPQAHMAMMFDLMVRKRAYLSEEDLIELNALCQVLPGPTSTQTVTAIGFRIGGPNLAYLTLLVWMLPAVTLMTIAAILISQLQEQEISLDFTRYLQPIAIGFVSYAAFLITRKVVRSKTAWVLMIISALISLRFSSPYTFPVLIFMGGITTAFKYKKHPVKEKQRITIQWANFLLWAGVFILAAGLGGITQALPVRLFENFYRSGSLIFGGGQVLIPFLHAEFVELKQLLTSQEFLTGYAIGQSVPGPVFSFCAYVGALSMRDYGTWGQILGSFVASMGIFLPGVFLIFFVIRFWDSLKKYRWVRASLEGVNAVSSGMVVAAVFLLFAPLGFSTVNVLLIIGTFSLLMFTRVPAPLIILVGLLAGIIL